MLAQVWPKNSVVSEAAQIPPQASTAGDIQRGTECMFFSKVTSPEQIPSPSLTDFPRDR